MGNVSLTATQALSHHRFRAAWLLVLVTAVTLGGGGCADDGQPRPVGPRSSADCQPGDLFDVVKTTCVSPTSIEEAKGLATREELERLRGLGDAVVLVEITFASPVTRGDFDAVIQNAQPALVEKIGYYFTVAGDGIAVTADTTTSAPVPDQLRERSEAFIVARYSGFEKPEMQSLATSFSQAFSSGKERYRAVRLKAQPSRLLDTWNRAPTITYVEVQERLP